MTAEVVETTISPDGQRAVETLEDGSTLERPPSLAEQVEFMRKEILDYMVRMVPLARSGVIETDAVEDGSSVAITISLGGPGLPPNRRPEPAPAPAKRTDSAENPTHPGRKGTRSA